MVKTEGDRSKEDQRFIKAIDKAFDMGSSGMGIQLHAVALLASGKIMPAWVEEAIVVEGSNYFGKYVSGWINPKGVYKNDGPKSFSPYANSHKTLILRTGELYEELENMHIKIMPDEFHSFPVELPKDLERFVFPDYDEQKNLFITEYGASEEVITRLMQDDIDEYVNRLRRRKIKERQFGEPFIKLNLKTAVYKLGAMLGLTEQLTYDAYQQGVPIPANYRPERFTEAWEETFGEPMPTIEELYAQAHGVFVEYADPNDPFVVHLFCLGIHCLN